MILPLSLTPLDDLFEQAALARAIGDDPVAARLEQVADELDTEIHRRLS